MKIRLVSTVNAPFSKVCDGFNINLFKYLLPPLGIAKIIRYDGQTPGDIVDLKFNLPFVGNWTIVIKESWTVPHEYGFSDRGLRVPMGIEYWRHTHRVVAKGSESCFIVDDIEYNTSFVLLDYLLYLPLLLAFYPRKFLYSKYFKTF